MRAGPHHRPLPGDGGLQLAHPQLAAAEGEAVDLARLGANVEALADDQRLSAKRRLGVELPQRLPGAALDRVQEPQV